MNTEPEKQTFSRSLLQGLDQTNEAVGHAMNILEAGKGRNSDSVFPNEAEWLKFPGIGKKTLDALDQLGVVTNGKSSRLPDPTKEDIKSERVRASLVLEERQLVEKIREQNKKLKKSRQRLRVVRKALLHPRNK